MTPELWAALIGAVVLLLTNTAAVIKIWGDNLATKDDRAATKEARDKDSLELHDKVLSLEFKSTQNKDNITLLFEQVADSNKQIALLNTQLATVLTKMDSVIDTLRELKDGIRNR
jgi:uncharacterized coiled-coil protein SlyX